MILEFGYGSGFQTVELPEANLLARLQANTMTHPRSGVDAVVYAMENPIGAPKLSRLPKAGQKVVIITSDISRPLPSYQVLPPVLEALQEAKAAGKIGHIGIGGRDSHGRYPRGLRPGFPPEAYPGGNGKAGW